MNFKENKNSRGAIIPFGTAVSNMPVVIKTKHPTNRLKGHYHGIVCAAKAEGQMRTRNGALLVSEETDAWDREGREVSGASQAWMRGGITDRCPGTRGSWNEVDEPRAYIDGKTKSEREKQVLYATQTHI